MDKFQDELKQIEMMEAQGAKIRPKNTWELEGEKCTKHFFHKVEKKRMQIRLYFPLKVGKKAKY